jgi:hypothetical protein
LFVFYGLILLLVDLNDLGSGLECQEEEQKGKDYLDGDIWQHDVEPDANKTAHQDSRHHN